MVFDAHGYCCRMGVLARHSTIDRAATRPTAALDISDTPRVLASAPLLYGGAFALGVLPRSIWEEPMLPPVIVGAIGPAFFICGAALAVWSNRVLRGAQTSPDPSQPTTALVVTGPYAFSRNPLYLARTLLYVGLALAMNMVWTLLTLGPLLALVHYGVIRREERYLEAKFGNAFRRYQATVRRWL